MDGAAPCSLNATPIMDTTFPQSSSHQHLNRDRSASILIIGIGNEYRSDDGLGLYAARELRVRFQSAEHGLPAPVVIIEHSGEGTALINAWTGYPHVFIIDAVHSGKLPGTVYTVDGVREPIPARMFFSSSHVFGVAEAIELARHLKQLPRTLKLYGIEAETFEPGIGLSEVVVRSMAELFHLIEHDARKVAESTASADVQKG